MTIQIVDRPLASNPPKFPKGALVAFRAQDGKVYTGTFLRRFSPARNAGFVYEIRVDGRPEQISANGVVGRSVTRVKA